jgi:hypothetical protein
MNLVKWKKVEDFGNSYYLDLGCFRGFTLLNIAVHSSMFWMYMPLFSLAGSILRGSVLSVELQLSALTFDVTVLNFGIPDADEDSLRPSE